MGRKKKEDQVKQDSKTTEIEKEPTTEKPKDVESQKIKIPDDPNLPKKSLFRVDEVADYFNVTERTIRLWIDHGHLECEKVVGTIQIPRESILNCRFREKGR